ncbi:MAG TPA: phosphohydrolase [Chloroflexi bacterium]|nr:phosphohydrolase [Chloroflexota bacterium]
MPEPALSPVTLATVRQDPLVTTFIRQANTYLRAIGYTEHGERHASLVANIARNVLLRLGHPERTAELAAMAGYLHDIGNVIHRENHALNGALIAKDVLLRAGMDLDEVALIINAVGNHEEEQGSVTSIVAAALAIADKSDVHRSRVQEPDPLQFDVHDRVNYAVVRSFVRVSDARDIITLELTIDTTASSVMEYFEIFLSRMLMCRAAAQTLGCRFALVVNDVQLF